MHFLYKTLFVSCFALALTACNNANDSVNQTSNTTQNIDTVASKDVVIQREKDYFSLKEFPLGIHVDSLEKSYDWIKDMHKEMSSNPTLEEIKIMVTLYERPGMLELNFNNKKLYSYYYTLDSVKQVAGDSIYTSFKNKLAKAHGNNFNEEAVNEGNHNSKSAFWNLGKEQVVITYNVGSRIISWGRQNNPHAQN